jgi:hypothetical protein
MLILERLSSTEDALGNGSTAGRGVVNIDGGSTTIGTRADKAVAPTTSRTRRTGDHRIPWLASPAARPKSGEGLAPPPVMAALQQRAFLLGCSWFSLESKSRNEHFALPVVLQPMNTHTQLQRSQEVTACLDQS